MNLIFRFLRRSQKRIPAVGEHWIVKPIDPSDPFPQKNLAPATILEIKNGWVRYKIGNCNFFNDERMKIGRFTGCYEICLR